MAGTKIEIAPGTRFGMWTVLGESDKRDACGRMYFKCRCDCGTEKDVGSISLRTGVSISCGCHKKNIVRDRVTDHPLYSTWLGMRGRCYTKTSRSYKNYGGRGIKVCKEWDDYCTFEKWALENGYRSDLSLDRINNDEDYSPDNCRFTTPFVQSRNKRNSVNVTVGGKTMNITDLAKEYGFKRLTLYLRWRRGVRGEDLLKPIDETKSHGKEIHEAHERRKKIAI